ncbi:MAG: ATP-binding protein [Myxococcota bacterium]|nr:ATP-binding protein [Myxococcota bacterium]
MTEPTDELAVHAPEELRHVLRMLCERMVRVCDGRVPPLGWSGIAPAIPAHAVAPMQPVTFELAQRMALTKTEQWMLAAALSQDLDGRFVGVWQLLGGRVDIVRPRVSELYQLASPAEQAEVLSILDPQSWLRATGLVQLATSEHLLAQPVVGSIAALGAELEAATLGVVVEPLCATSVPTVSRTARDIPLEGHGIPRRRQHEPHALLVIEGPAGSGRRFHARACARDIGLGTATVTVADAQAHVQVRALLRVAICERVVPVLELAGNIDPAPLLALFRDYAGPLVLIAETTPALPDVWLTQRIVLHRPDVALRRTLWTRALGVADGSDEIADLARRFPLGCSAISRAADKARHRTGDPPTLLALADAAREELETTSTLVERVRSERRLDDLIASPTTIALIKEVIAFARYRHVVFDDWGFGQRASGGLKVLFSGPPGTGKTMSAEIIAAELDLDLFRIDLSNVVSKWVGETEKNLKAVFDQADANGGVLLFDEADALFGKRTSNVSSSNDRHANMEINYLLQRMEAFDGVCLLTTNIESGIDEAFKRRLNFRVRFEAPDANERARLWRLMIPPQAPRGTLDFAEVAEEFELTGGNIRNAAIRAAVLAAHDGVPLGTHHLLEAATREYGELGRISR